MYLLLFHCPSQFARWRGSTSYCVLPEPCHLLREEMVFFLTLIIQKNPAPYPPKTQKTPNFWFWQPARLVFSSVQIQRQHWRGLQSVMFWNELGNGTYCEESSLFPTCLQVDFSTPVQQHKSGLHFVCLVCYFVDLNHLRSSVKQNSNKDWGGGC